MILYPFLSYPSKRGVTVMYENGLMFVDYEMGAMEDNGIEWKICPFLGMPEWNGNHLLFWECRSKKKNWSDILFWDCQILLWLDCDGNRSQTCFVSLVSFYRSSRVEETLRRNGRNGKEIEILDVVNYWFSERGNVGNDVTAPKIDKFLFVLFLMKL